jgi:hypothetical protein
VFLAFCLFPRIDSITNSLPIQTEDKISIKYSGASNNRCPSGSVLGSILSLWTA